MSTWTRRARRSLVATVGTGALVVAMASPANAALIVNDDVTAEITDGNIHVGNSDFGLGDSAEPAPTCNPSGAPSTIEATVGPESGGSATVSNFDFEFTQAEFEAGGDTICVQIVVDNEGSVTGTLTRTTGQDATLSISGANVDVLVDGGPCGINNISVGTISGTVDGDPVPNVATIGTTSPFNVPGFSGCGFFLNAILNGLFDVPANNGDVDLVLEISPA